MADITGTNGSELLFGTGGADDIRGRNDADLIIAGGGNDTIRAGGGDDLVLAGSGDDRIFSGNGDDIVLAGDGDDRIVGGRGSDLLLGGAGDDTFVYRPAINAGESDTYIGGPGNDRLVLRLTAEEAADTAIQADIAAFEAFLATSPGGLFTFSAFDLTVVGIERLTVRAPDVDSPANAAPTVSGPVALEGAAEDQAFVVTAADLLANASDADGDALSVINLSAGPNAAILDQGDGTFLVTPAADFNGALTLSYGVTDGEAATAATATLDVAPVNDAPEITGTVTLAAIEDEALVIDPALLLADASDVDGDTLSVVNVMSDVGTVTQTEAGIVLTTPADFNGTVTLSYDVTDGTALSPAIATVEVNAINDAPVVSGPVVLEGADEDSPILFSAADLLANASDVDGDALSVLNVTADAGTLVETEDGFALTPPADFNGTVTISYDVTDGDAVVAAAATIEVAAVNDAPIAVDEAVSVGEDGSAVVGVLDNDSDPDGDPLTITALSSSATVTATDNRDGTITVAPTAAAQSLDDGETLVETVTYEIQDGNGGIATGSVTITIEGEKDAPVIDGVADAGITVENLAVLIEERFLLGEVSDVDGDVVSVGAISSPNGTVEPVDGGFLFTPAEGFFGTAILNFNVTDGDAIRPASATVVVVEGENEAPEVSGPVALGSIAEDGAVVVDVATLLANASDADGDALDVANLMLPAGFGEAVRDGDTFSFAPPADFNGDVTISYDVTDGEDATGATATLSVTPVNDAPVASGPVDLGEIDEDTPLLTSVTALLANATDVDGDALGVSNVTANSAAVSVVGADISIVPQQDFNGVITLTYDVEDGNGGSVSTSATLTVAPVDDAPVAVGDFEATDDDTAITFDVLGNDFDVDGNPIFVAGIDSSDTDAEVTLNLDGTITFDPLGTSVGALLPGENSVETFTYTLQDTTGLQSTATVSVAVAGVNSQIVANDDVAFFNVGVESNFRLGEPVFLDPVFNDRDAEGAGDPYGSAWTITALDAAEDGYTVEVSDAFQFPTLQFTPGEDFFDFGEEEPGGPVLGRERTVTFDYTVSDGETSDTATFTVTYRDEFIDVVG